MRDRHRTFFIAGSTLGIFCFFVVSLSASADEKPLKPSSEISHRVPGGYRAVTIPVTVTPASEKWIVDGARVDVVWRTTIRGKRLAKVLAEDASVLDVVLNGGRQGSNNSSASVTVLVTQKDSLELQLAETDGSLSLSLRGDYNKDKFSEREVTLEEIIQSRESRPRLSGRKGTLVIDNEKYIVNDDGSLTPIRAKKR